MSKYSRVTSFKKAKTALKKIANGKYHTVFYEVREYSDGQLTNECSVYIDGLSHYIGETWQEAFEKLDRAMNPSTLTENDIDDIKQLEK